MKKKEKKIDENLYMCGYTNGKKQTVEDILKFVDKESEFIPNVHCDTLLDRLVQFIKNL